jgi:Protein of unknown function (DUF1612)
LAKALHAIDAVLERSGRVIDVELAEPHSDTWSTPVLLRTAILLDAWGDIDLLEHAAWLGPLLVAALLRREGVAGHDLLSWSAA